MLKVATWNINSVRLRIELVTQFLLDHQPDVLCLQETKTIDDCFPKAAFEAAGYKHLYYNGMKSYNGVAIISKEPLSECEIINHCEKQDCRHIVAKHASGIHIHSIYIPAGGDVPDPVENEKFAHKLGFVKSLTSYFSAQKQLDQSHILLGDFNIAPHENDVWSHKQLLKIVSHTPVEVDHLNGFLAAGKFTDAARFLSQDDEKLYSWWSYRARDWRASNRGRRLDHIWTSADLHGYIASSDFFKDLRSGLPKPSDHVPVMLTLKKAV